MKHENSGEYCLVAHFDKKGLLLPPCIRCKNCYKWIRPKDMEEECKIINFKDSQ